MPKYKFSFERTYSITEGFERVIEAPSLDEAIAAAHNLASGFDMDCPDDCSEFEDGDTEIGDFGADGGDEVESATADYIVLPDGQVVGSEE